MHDHRFMEPIVVDPDNSPLEAHWGRPWWHRLAALLLAAPNPIALVSILAILGVVYMTETTAADRELVALCILAIGSIGVTDMIRKRRNDKRIRTSSPDHASEDKGEARPSSGADSGDVDDRSHTAGHRAL